MFRKLFLFVFIFLLLLTSCMKDRKHANPFDPLTSIVTSPTGLTMEQKTVTSIQLRWIDTYDGETGYRIDRKNGNGAWQPKYAELPPNTKIYDDLEAQPLQTYTYKVFAQFDLNYSLPKSGNIQTIFPAPSNLALTQTNASTVKLTWVDNSIGEEGFVIDRKVGPGNWISNYAAAAANAIQYMDTGITWGTVYYYRVKAKSGNIYSTAIETSLTPTFPGPTNLVLTQTGATSATLHWQDNTSWEDAYIIDRKKGNGNWVNNYASVSANATQLTDSSISPDTTYIYRVRAKAGTIYSNYAEQSIIPTFPAANSLVLSQSALTSIHLQWQDTNPWEERYMIDRKEGTGNWVLNYANVGANVTQFNDTSVIPSHVYTYRIKALSGIISSTTIESSITPTFPAPKNLTLSQTSLTSVQLQWQDSYHWADSFIIDRKVGNGSWTINYASASANSTQLTDSDVIPGITYFYRVKAKSGVYSSDYSESSISITFPAPSNVTLSQTGGTIQIHWQDNSAWEDGFIIDRKYESENWNLNYSSVNHNTTEFSDTTITAVGTYYYRIKAVSGAFSSSTVESSLNVTFPIPSNFGLTQVAAASIRLQWQYNSTWEDSFVIDRRIGTGAWVTNYATTGENATQYFDVNLTTVDTYSYRLRAKAGQLSSDYVESSILIDFPAPSNLALTQTNASSIHLQWLDNGTWESRFVIDRKVRNGAWSLNYISLNPNVTQYTDTGLTLGTQYTYRIKAITGDLCSNNSAEVSLELTNTLKLVPGGSFNNGSSNVTISNFNIAMYEVTQSEYLEVMQNNPASFSTNLNKPVEQVSWFDAVEYCNKRSMSGGLTPCYSYDTNGTDPNFWPAGWNANDDNHVNITCNWSANGYRLPTEAEWEYAARGANQTHNYTYSGSNTLSNVAWYNSNSGTISNIVGTKISNEILLFDLSGNVWEWCWDIFGIYPTEAQVNPHGARSGTSHVVRGGSWGSNASGCAVSYRGYTNPTSQSNDIGFRVCRIVP